MELNERRREILAAVIEAYIRTGEPVGSKTLADMLKNAVSSATIRNEMVELSNTGYLEQPHPSAGRIPTAKGLRLYIDSLMHRRPLTEEKKRRIDQMLQSVSGDPDRLMEDAAQALANATGCVALTTTPDRQCASIRRIELLRIGAKTAAIVLMTSTGLLRSRVCRFEREIEDALLERLGRMLNAQFAGQPLSEVSLPELQSLLALMGEGSLLCAPALTAFDELVRESTKADVRMTGELNLLKSPDYELKRVRSLLHFLSKRQQLASMLTACPGELRVLLGSESAQPELSGSSIILTHYLPGTRQDGRIGVIGPQRMDYAETISQLEYFARALGRLMTAFMES